MMTFKWTMAAMPEKPFAAMARQVTITEAVNMTNSNTVLLGLADLG